MTPSSAQDDLAFLRALTDGDVARKHQAIFGRIYFGAGLIYGAQIVLSLLHNTHVLAFPGGDELLSLLANGIFLSWLGWEIWKNRGAGAGTLTNKAINAAFAAIGATNLVVCLILFVGAWRLGDPRIAILIPCMIFALQGAGWFVAYRLRRRIWLGLVAAGWTGTSIAMAFTVGDHIAFLSLIAFAIFAWMAVPGLVMMRLAARAD
jgi:hypothetical protein